MRFSQDISIYKYSTKFMKQLNMGRNDSMKSMTGFGRGVLKNDQYECVVEIKTINHRFKDFSIRMPRQFNCIEDRIRKCVNHFITRGRIEIYIRFNFLEREERDVNI